MQVYMCVCFWCLLNVESYYPVSVGTVLIFVAVESNYSVFQILQSVIILFCVLCFCHSLLYQRLFH